MSTNTAADRAGRAFGRGRRLLIPLLLLAVGIGVSESAGAELASVRVRTADPGRPIWIGEVYAGSSPAEADSLPPGSVEIRVGPPRWTAGWIRPWRTEVRLRPGENREILVPTLQRLEVVSTPASARVRIEGREVGWTPLHVLVPARGPLDLELRTAGGVERSLRYEGGGRADSTLRVALSTPGSPAGRPELVAAPSIGPDRTQYLLPIGAVLAGVVGVWARQNAERAYDDYLRTLDRGEMQRKLDRAERFDRIAVGFWIGAETLLVASVWTWLRGSSTEAQAVKVQTDPDRIRVGVSLDALLPGSGRPAGAGPRDAP